MEKINTELIKQKYNDQSFIKILNYSLDINSRIISNDSGRLKLTEREVDIILFLNDHKKPQKVNVLQNQVWKYSSELETHTVETHIYRLRKKIADTFNDNDFILSHDDVVTLGVIAILTFFLIDQNNNVLKITGAQRYDVFKEVFDSLVEK